MLNWILRKIFRISTTPLNSIHPHIEHTDDELRNFNSLYIPENEPIGYCRFCNSHSHNIFGCNHPSVNETLNEYITNAFRLKYDHHLLYIYLFQKQRVVLQMIAIRNRINISRKSHSEIAEEIMQKFLLSTIINRRHIYSTENRANMSFEITRRQQTQLFNMMCIDIGLQPNVLNDETSHYEERDNGNIYAIQNGNDQYVTHRVRERIMRMRIMRRFTNNSFIPSEPTEPTEPTENQTEYIHLNPSIPLELAEMSNFTAKNKCYGECPICFDTNDNAEQNITFVTTNCDHSFCISCIKKIISQKLLSNTTQNIFEPTKFALQCPLCRTTVNSLYAESKTDLLKLVALKNLHA